MQRCGSATVTAAVSATTAKAATTAAATAMTATAAGQAVNAGACWVRLTAGAHGPAVGQVQTRKLRGFQRIDVAWQLVAITTATVLATTLTATVGVRTTALTTTFRTWTIARTTALAVATVVKTTAFALTFKTGFTLRAIAA